jgi:hypothetical protein
MANQADKEEHEEGLVKLRRCGRNGRRVDTNTLMTCRKMACSSSILDPSFLLPLAMLSARPQTNTKEAFNSITRRTVPAVSHHR